MNCMKCGRETENEAVFCQECLLEMQKYPVRPGIVVQLPRRKENASLKKLSKRHAQSTDEQIKTLRKAVNLLMLLLIMCITAIILMFKPTMHYVLDEHVEVGQNYSSVISSATYEKPQNEQR